MRIRRSVMPSIMLSTLSKTRDFLCMRITLLYWRKNTTLAQDFSNTKKEAQLKLLTIHLDNSIKFQIKKGTSLEDKQKCTKSLMLCSKRRTELSQSKEWVGLVKQHSQRRFATSWFIEIHLWMEFCTFQCILFYEQALCINEFLRKCNDNQIEKSKSLKMFSK